MNCGACCTADLPTGGRVGFWYTNEVSESVPNLYDGLNGLWLWGYSRLGTWDNDDPTKYPGVPTLSDVEAERLDYYMEIAILADTRAEAEAGVERLKEEGWMEPAVYREFRRGELRVAIATVRSPNKRRKCRAGQEAGRTGRTAEAPGGEAGGEGGQEGCESEGVKSA